VGTRRWCAGGEIARAVRHLGNAVDGEHHVVGDEVIAVLEFGVAQPKLPGIGCDQLPGFGETRHQVGVLVHLDQPVEDLAGQRDVGREVVVMRIDAGYRRTHRDPQRLPARRHGACRQTRAKRNTHTTPHGPLPRPVRLGL
jgi:hypothetical protein